MAIGRQAYGEPFFTRRFGCQRRICANVVLTVTLLTLGACVNEHPASPNPSAAPRVASDVTRQLVGGSFSLPIPSNSAAPLLGGAPWQATGFKVLGGVNVRARMPSTMMASFNQPAPPDPSSCMPWNVPEGEVSPSLNPMAGQPLLGTLQYTITADSIGTIPSNPSMRGGWTRFGKRQLDACFVLSVRISAWLLVVHALRTRWRVQWLRQVQSGR